jgi:hypothetical protein
MLKKLRALHTLIVNYNMVCESAPSYTLEQDVRHALCMGPTEVIFSPQERKLISSIKERMSSLIQPETRLLLQEWP